MIPIIYSDEFLAHDTGSFHPEQPARLMAIVKAIKTAPWADLIAWQLPTPIEERPIDLYLQQAHAREYIEQVQLISQAGGGQLDADTPISRRSYGIALLAISAWIDGVERVLETGKPAFVLARPPGHHAVKTRGMGFCLFGNAAIAAYYALAQPDIERVAILDWDVHHGNGTQDIVENHPEIAYCSLHQYPCYPGTGDASDRGYHENVLNIPLKPGSGLAEYRQAFEVQVMPFLTQFRPDLLIVSAGYDANAADPLASINLQPQDFGLFTDYCLQLTRRIVFGLEGGYDLQALGKSVVATIERLTVNS